MENQTTPVRRPIGVWVVVALYSLLMLGNLALTIYLHFWSDHSARLQALYADWTLLDYAIKFYPVWLPRVVLLLVPAIAFLYGLYLWKKGTLRKGWA